MILQLSIFAYILSLLLNKCIAYQIFRSEVYVNSSELTVFTIQPSLFNWELDSEYNNRIEYSTRTSNAPDLPSWLYYAYHSEGSVGYLYGVPPMNLSAGPINVDVIARNRKESFEIRQLIITYSVLPQPEQQFVVELKIDNMDARDFCNPAEQQRLIQIFTSYLDWQRLDGSSVTPVFLASASAKVHSTTPYPFAEKQGAVIHLGSDRNFSAELYKLQQQVQPLYKLKPCPRDLKRTSMEKYFRSQDFLIDWCSFKLTYNNPTIDHVRQRNTYDTKGDYIREDGAEDVSTANLYFRESIPERSYTSGILLATIVPGAIGAFLTLILIGIFWNDDDESAPVWKTDEQDSIRLLRNASVPDGSYQQYHAPGNNEEDYFLLTADGRHEPERELVRERAATPLPPQYATHPNGSPALTYAV